MKETAVLRHMPRNLWRTWERVNFPLSGLALYLPLWHPELDGDTIVSKDLNAHVCTVIGALWTPQGREFTGGDDYIKHKAADWRSADSQGTISIWFKTSTQSSMVLLSSDDEASNVNYFKLYILATGSLQITTRNGVADSVHALNAEGTWNDGIWHCGVLSSDGSVYSFIIDGVTASLTGTNDNGNWFADIDLRDSVALGVNLDSIPDSFFTGTIGEVIVHNLPITLAEHNNMRLATKWRYS